LYYDIQKGRDNIASVIEDLKSIHKIRPASYNLQTFFYAKSSEIVSIFQPAPEDEKKPIYETCKLLDAGNITKYEKIMQ
jgi:hypothetical protein